ncbi:MAG TPA: ribulose-phosphate 3-epimerase [Candidatus Eisenbacteria bacterium]|nr:ribulose-phosphate 3-epimerase [Candidatus Eisenbacteria bacterium]
MNARPAVVAPSLLSADFSRLAEALAIVEPGRDWVHCDVMDHHFVPNLTFGPIVVAAAHRLSAAHLDVHLMIERPWLVVDAFREAGAGAITVHLEACPQTRETLRRIRAAGARAGLAIKPGTPYAAAEPYLPDLDLLLVMTVEPGFGGQEFQPAMLAKVTAAAAERERRRLDFRIEVDGGIHAGTARLARDAGADAFVAGHAIYRAPDPRAALAALRREVGA